MKSSILCPPLPQTSIDTIAQWIREGAPQN